MTKEEIEKESFEALKKSEGGNMNLWPVPDNAEMRCYWLEIWREGATWMNGKNEELERVIEHQEYYIKQLLKVNNPDGLDLDRVEKELTEELSAMESTRQSLICTNSCFDWKQCHEFGCQKP